MPLSDYNRATIENDNRKYSEQINMLIEVVRVNSGFFGNWDVKDEANRALKVLISKLHRNILMLEVI